MSSVDTIKTIGEALAEAWGTLFSKKVSIENPSCELLAESAYALDIAESLVSCSIEFSGDAEGSCRYLIPEKQALTMVGMMLSMGADDALIESTREGSIGAEEIDALNECFNQLSATTATVLRDIKSCDLQIKPGTPERISSDSIEGFGDGDQISTCELELEGFEKGQLYCIMDASVSAFLGTEEESAPDVEDSEESVPEAETSEPSPAVAQNNPDTPPGPNLDAIRDLKVSTDVILAERLMDFTQLLKLNVGSVVEFWKPCDHPAELSLGNTSYAAGEIVISQDQYFGLRVLELAPSKKTYQKGLS